MNRLMEVYLYWRSTSTGENVQFICRNFHMMKTLHIRGGPMTDQGLLYLSVGKVEGIKGDDSI